jgi:cell wall-associated NlpC family hydrolase
MQTDFTKLLDRWNAGERNLSNYNGSKIYNDVNDIYADLSAKLDAAQKGEKIKYEGSGEDFSDKDQASALDKFIKGYNSQGGKYSSYSYPNTYSNKIVDKASNYLGIKYTYGGKDASTGLDCSGLVYKALNDAGVNVPILTAEGYKQMAKSIS